MEVLHWEPHKPSSNLLHIGVGQLRQGDNLSIMLKLQHNLQPEPPGKQKLLTTAPLRAKHSQNTSQ